MVLSIFEARQAKVEKSGGDAMQAVAAMPESSCALYEIASQAVLEREGLLAATESGMGGKRGGAATVNQLTQLLQAPFFEAITLTPTPDERSYNPPPSPSPCSRRSSSRRMLPSVASSMRASSRRRLLGW